jgi:peptidoglycan hydrolase CwlO-like protein
MIRNISIVFFLSFLISSMILAGCEGRDDNSEAAKAQLLLPKVQKDLERTRRSLNSLSDQLRIVQHERDQLIQQVRQISSARDDAVSTAQNVEGMSTKINEQSERIKYLEDEIDRLNSVIEEQGVTISQQQATIAELVSLIDQEPVTDGQQEVFDQQVDNY